VCDCSTSLHLGHCQADDWFSGAWYDEGMAQTKNKRRKQQERHQAPAESSSAGWIGPVAVLIVGLVAIAWQSGLFESETGPAVAESPQERSGERPPTRPVIMTDFGEIGRRDAANWEEVDDPTADGWNTEAAHDVIKKRLNVIGRLLVNPAKADAAALTPVLTADFRSGPLRPAELKSVMQDEATIVERGTLAEDQELSKTTAGELAEKIQELTGPLRDAENSRFQFKVMRVDEGIDEIETEQLLSLSGETADGFFEQHARWVTAWDVTNSKKPNLLSLRVIRFEQIRANQPTKSLFTDCTDSALRDNPCYENQILLGANHWFERIPFRAMLNLFSMPGIAVGDVNGDGLEDLYLCQDPGIPNRLFLQNPDGTAREVSADWGVDWLEDARSVLLVDLDNDGDQDLVLAIRGNVVLAENIDQQKFRVHTVLTPSNDPTSLCAFDYDSDGRLDIYVCAYHPDEFLQESSGEALGAARQQFVVHDANDAAANSLFRNQSKPGERWKFEDVTEAVGLDVNNRRWSFAAAAEDYDNDGDQDLYVANDYGRDNLYRNDVDENGVRKFVDVSDEAQIEDSAGGMAMTWGDYDRDGLVDAFVSNMWSSAGHRITGQRQFKPDLDENLRQRFRHVAEGNTLMRNSPGHTFENRTLSAGVEMGRWAWGNRFFDLNNDGWDDLIVANGYMTTGDTGDL